MLWTDKVGWGLVALDVAVDATMRTSPGPGPGSTSARAAASLAAEGSSGTIRASVCTANEIDATPVALSPDGGHRSFGSRAITAGQR
jgi:hypothetical protein